MGLSLFTKRDQQSNQRDKQKQNISLTTLYSSSSPTITEPQTTTGPQSLDTIFNNPTYTDTVLDKRSTYQFGFTPTTNTNSNSNSNSNNNSNTHPTSSGKQRKNTRRRTRSRHTQHHKNQRNLSEIKLVPLEYYSPARTTLTSTSTTAAVAVTVAGKPKITATSSSTSSSSRGKSTTAFITNSIGKTKQIFERKKEAKKESKESKQPKQPKETKNRIMMMKKMMTRKKNDHHDDTNHTNHPNTHSNQMIGSHSHTQHHNHNHNHQQHKPKRRISFRRNESSKSHGEYSASTIPMKTSSTTSAYTPKAPQPLILSPPEKDIAHFSLDARRVTTPKAKGRSTLLNRSNTEKRNNRGRRGGDGCGDGNGGRSHHDTTMNNNTTSMDSNSEMNKQEYELPHSITFLSLALLSQNNGGNEMGGTDLNSLLEEDHRRRGTPSMISVSDATTAASTIATDILSITSGQTALAKDRVQETIACSVNIHHYLDSINNMDIHMDHNDDDDSSNNKNGNNSQSPKSVSNFPPPPLTQEKHDHPVNVDFVLESNESEIASFANSFIQSKQYVEAIDIYLTVMNHYQKQFGFQYAFVITTLHNLGVVHVLNGNYKKALYFCKEALKRRRKTLGPDHIDVATSLCELGIIYYAREDFNRGLDVLRQALHIACKTMGSDNPHYKMSSILNNIGCIHYSMGKLIASIATFEESLDIQRRIMGSVASDEAGYMLLNMSLTLCNAGIVSAKHNKPSIASSLVEEGLIVQQSILPDDHRVVKATLLTLKRLLNEDENSEPLQPIDKLEINLPRQLSTVSQSSINESMHRCTDMLSIGSIQNELSSQQRVSISMHYKYLAQTILLEGDSKRHCSWVDVRDNNEHDRDFDLSQVCEQASRYIQKKQTAKATELFHQIRRSRTNKCGDVDFIVASVHHILGLIYLHTQNYQSARVEFQEATKMRSQQLDPDHFDVLASQTKRAISMIALQEFDNALTTFQKLLTHLRKRFGYTNYRVAIILNNIGICHYELGGFLTALKSFEETVEILREASINCQKDGHDDEKKFLLILLGRSLNNLSFIRFKRKEYAEAVVVLEEGLKIQRDAFGNNHKQVKSNIENLAFTMATANCLDNKDKLIHTTEMYIEMLK